MSDMRPIEEVDPQLAELIKKEATRQRAQIHLIASENYVSYAMMQASGSVLTNKYSEGYPGRRYYEGCEVIDEVENLARDRAKRLFQAEHANVQAHSGSQANLAAYLAVLEPGDTILGMALDQGGHLTHGSPVNLSGQSYEDYMAQRPAWLRNTIARKRRKLEREQGYEIRLYTDDDLDQAKADYNTIYQSSWKANELIEGFLERLLKNMTASGWLRLAILYISGRPAAAQIWFVAHGKASIFRLVYDDAWKRYSPGTILTDYLVKHVIDVDRVEEIDFLTGNDAYKQDWMSVRRQRWALVFIRDRVTRSRGERFAMLLKDLVKRFNG